MTEREWDLIVAQMVSLDRETWRVTIAVGPSEDDRVALEPKATPTAAKAQMADACWIVKQVLKRGADLAGGGRV